MPLTYTKSTCTLVILILQGHKNNERHPINIVLQVGMVRRIGRLWLKEYNESIYKILGRHHACI